MRPLNPVTNKREAEIVAVLDVIIAKLEANTAKLETNISATLPDPGTPNTLLPGVSKHWYVSYNDRDTAAYGGVTTALVIGQMEYFLILNGDHREGLRAKYLRDCIQYIRDHRDQLNKRSEPLI